jgi:helix-turn-helix protein
MITTPQVAASASRLAREIDTAWSTCPITLRRATSLGLSGWAFYVAGRGGALGSDAHPDTVAAALGFIAPDAVRAGWEAARAVGAAVVADARLAECARWGEQCLGDGSPGGADLAALAGLAQRVVAAADPSGMPLFAAWRARQPATSGIGARVALLAHLLSELRAGAHLLAVRTCGLTPVEATIAGPAGVEEALALGWQPPFPPRIPLLRRYAYAEAVGDRITGRAYAELTPGERTELIRLLTAVAAATGTGEPKPLDRPQPDRQDDQS